jgi:hypothetical protein
LKPYINPYIGGTLLGVVLFAAFFITGNGLGASGAINRVQIGILKVFAPEHVNKVGYLAKIGGGTANPWDSPGVAMLLGTFVGGMLSGLYFRRFKLEVRKGAGVSTKTRILMALLGGTIMGYGARISRGCTSGQALSGGAVLSVGSWAFMFSVFAGGYLVAYFVRRFWQEGDC